jgi:hypothetical protein
VSARSQIGGTESKGPMSCRRATRLILAMPRIPACRRFAAPLHLQQAPFWQHVSLPLSVIYRDRDAAFLVYMRQAVGHSCQTPPLRF